MTHVTEMELDALRTCCNMDGSADSMINDARQQARVQRSWFQHTGANLTGGTLPDIQA